MNPVGLISIVVPVYKEEKNITPFLKRIVPVLTGIGARYEIIFALDPSPDQTEEVITHELQKNPSIKLLVFSRRFGQPAATLAGLKECNGDVCIIIDVDLQDPPELITSMVDLYLEGFEVIYAMRRSRQGETLIKKAIAYVGYALINRLSDVKIPRNTGDFRLISRRVINTIVNLNETHGFLRGLVAFAGFRQTSIEYDRDPRFSGAGNYNRFFGSIRIGMNGIISFSSKPLFMMSIVGLFLAFFSFALGGWYVLQKFLGYDLSPGLPTMVLLVTFFAGIQLLGLGLIGEYVGRIYDEVKRRPLYILDKKINFDAQNDEI